MIRRSVVAGHVKRKENGITSVKAMTDYTLVSGHSFALLPCRTASLYQT